jgi:hypothetical protein
MTEMDFARYAGQLRPLTGRDMDLVAELERELIAELDRVLLKEKDTDTETTEGDHTPRHQWRAR